jgi:hypothetical protein
MLGVRLVRSVPLGSVSVMVPDPPPPPVTRVPTHPLAHASTPRIEKSVMFLLVAPAVTVTVYVFVLLSAAVTV